jgi:2-hydroxychromene-2-carboxylate isomerase
MTTLEFWYDFHSPWAYLAATQIEGLAQRHGTGVQWRALHLPKLNAAIKGRRPLKENPAFIAWYKQDLQDWAALYGVTVRYHPAYPLKPARALRAAIRAGELGAAAAFALAVFRAYWTESRDISDLHVLGNLAAACGLDSAEIARAAMDDHYRHILESNTQEAVDRGVFGVPSIFWKKKLFFGNDRLGLLERWLSKEGRS